ncbi:MAG TPA: bifunctional ADP-dependent NAD(P)H-hydrate dehydratase/NAD(P)H-hydrate epimerase, partial [Candidatus Omnitrophica bacterium]|nr:bifunctional ADP-dependent NAD(P)H-hydrate dehydratase/NAD(P)H-hydrate epimerase [Candidatus Omnitrophota bacterium]
RNINNTQTLVLSVDIPSGLDADSGARPGICVEADKTITFVSIKTGMTGTSGSSYCGEIVIRDIGFPAYSLNILSS